MSDLDKARPRPDLEVMVKQTPEALDCEVLVVGGGMVGLTLGLTIPPPITSTSQSSASGVCFTMTSRSGLGHALSRSDI